MRFPARSLMPRSWRALSALVFVALLIAGVLPWTGASPVLAVEPGTTFADEFDGTAIDTTKWDTSIGTSGNRWCDVGAGTATNGTWFATATGLCHGLRQNPPYGVLTETAAAPGTANFSAGSNRAFPYMWSKDGLVPATGDFVLDFRMAYTSVAGNGDGIRLLSWPDPTPSGTNAPIKLDTKCALAGVWAGSGSGLLVNLAGKGVTLGNTNAFHSYRLEYVNGKYLLFHRLLETSPWMLLIGPVETTDRIDRAWLGNPVFTWWGLGDWSDFKIDYLRVAQPPLIDTDENLIADGVQTWTPAGGVPPSPQPDGDSDGKPDFCDTTANPPGPGTIVVAKQTDPDGATTPFTFSGASSGSISDGQTLTATVSAGSHTVTEAATTGWDLSAISCDDDDSTVSPAAASATYQVAAGETVTCTFTNRQQTGVEDPPLPPTQWDSTSSRWCPPAGLWRVVASQPCAGLTQAPPYGSITGAGGDLKFAAGRNTRAFPYTWTRDGVVPTTGDFVVEMRLKYDSLTSHGDGFRGRPWADATPVGGNSPLARGAERCGTFGVWGDTGGLRTSLMGITAPVGSGGLAFHTYRFEYVNGKYLVFVDDVLRIGPISSVMRADRLWLGNPIFTYWASADWSDFTLDYVRVSQPAFIDGDANGEYDGSQAWTPVRVPASAARDTDEDGLPDYCDPNNTPLEPGEIIVVKDTDPDGASAQFSFSGAASGTIGDEQVLRASVAPGSHTVTEAATPGWDLSGISCDDDDSTVNTATATATYVVEPGETITCIFSNRQATEVPPIEFWHTTDARWCTASQLWRLVATEPCAGVTQPGPYGSVTTDVNGDLAFKANATTRAFPYRWSPDGLLGDGGDFVVEMRLKYDSLTSHGDGFRGRPWADATPVGGNSPLARGAERCGTFGVWGDTGGLRTSLMGITAPVGSGGLAFHTYRFEYVNGKYLVFVDDVLRIGPISSVMRADRLWLGNPIFTYWASADWSDFTLDYVRVSQPAFIDGDANGEYDGSQAWTPVRVPASAARDTDEDGLPDYCDPNNTPLEPGEIIVVKDTDPDGASAQFSFSGAASGTIGDEQVLRASVAPGSHTVTEAATPGWDLSGISCDDDDSTVNTATATATYVVEPGETITCIFSNERTGPDLRITKGAAPNPVLAGGILTYTLVATNLGPSAATGVTVTDSLPASVTFVSATSTVGSCGHAAPTVTCTVGSLASGASATIEIKVRPQTAGSLTNSASITGTEGDPDPTNNTASVTTGVNPGADLRITKGAAPNPVLAGGILTYTLVATNLGPSAATGVTVTDSLPASVTFVSATSTVGSCGHAAPTVTCTVGSLASGASATIEIKVRPQTAGSLTNSASITGTEGDPDPTNNTASVTTGVNPGADLRITKGAAPNPVLAGGILTYTLVATNLGPSAATGVTVTDSLPASVTFVSATSTVGSCGHAAPTVTCTVGSLASGASATIEIKVRPQTAGSLTNSASITGTEGDPDPTNNTASVTTGVNPGADLRITKGAAPNPVLAGGILTYTLVATNLGPSAATGVTVTDSLPASVTFVSATSTVGSCGHAAPTVTCALGSLANGAGATVTITVRPQIAGPLANAASVGGTEGDPNPTNNTASVTTTVNPGGDLSVTKTASINPAHVGQPLTYTIVVRNDGPYAAVGVTLTDDLPKNAGYGTPTTTQGTCTIKPAKRLVTCNLGNIASGASVTVTIVIKPTSKGTITNTVSVSASSPPDPNLANNTAIATTTVVP